MDCGLTSACRMVVKTQDNGGVSMLVILRKARWFFLLLLVGVSAFRVSLFAATQGADAMLWQGLAEGRYVALMRHAKAPGVGDPSNFELGDCSTQRNLSAGGREQAQGIGEVMRGQGIREARVYSSAWCRCLDTGVELGFGDVKISEPLNSFFQDRNAAQSQTQALNDFVASTTEVGSPLILITHQVNITALTGVFPASGEIVVIEPTNAGEVEVRGRLMPVTR